MTLSSSIPLDAVFTNLRVPDKARLLTELSRRAAPVIGRAAQEVSALLVAREGLGSTGVGAGLAMPHARIDGLEQPAAFLARLERAIDYEAIDGRPVDLVFLLLTPSDGAAEHLAILAAASRRLRDKAVAERARAAKDAAGLRAALVGDTE